MNCERCGAPLGVEKDQFVFHCQYCGSYQFPVPNHDGVALLDEVSSYTCPQCSTALVSAVIQNVGIFSCPNCRGNLIPQENMLPILRQARYTRPEGEPPQGSADKSEFKRKSACPNCRRVMEDYPYGGPGNVIIQGCHNCQLIWLDYGELFRVLYANWELYKNSPDELGTRKRSILY